jgi:fructokinase
MFIVCGEALFDVFATAQTPGGMAFEGRIGGSPFNVAMGLARLNQPVGFFGGIGSGFLGERLMRAFADEGIDTSSVARIDAPTTLSVIGLDAKGVPSYGFYGDHAADRLVQVSHLSAVPPANCFHFGSFAMVVEPTAATQRLLVEREWARSVISYDPNIRTNVEPDLEVWREALRWMLSHTHLLKVSDEDLGLLYPHRTAEDFAAEALACGVALVIVTRGGEGALGFTPRDRVTVAPARVEVVDTVGAGDTFQAAVLAWLSEQQCLSPEGIGALSGAEVERALRFAAKAAAITCSRRGADLPRRAELGSDP